MSDSKEEVLRCLAEYQNVNIYTSSIVDVVIVALATVAYITIVAYYLDGLTIKNHVFKPTKIKVLPSRRCVLSMVIMSYLSTPQLKLDLNMKVSFLNKISKHQTKKLFKNLHHQKLNIPYNFFHRHNV